MFPRLVLRLIPAAAFVLLSTVLLYLHSRTLRSPIDTKIGQSNGILRQELDSLRAGPAPPVQILSNRTFETGKLYPPGHRYTMMVVVPKKKAESTQWLDDDLPNIPKAVYVVDDPNAPLRPPKNKGHEAIVYLSYIIDFYEDLPDISLFIHSHRFAWHTNDLFENDMVANIQRLIPQHVVRHGFLNLRCQWYPGCPRWLDPHTKVEDEEKREELIVSRVWPELFPVDALPENLAQPCCSQFAITRERIRSLPREEYLRLREWLLTSSLDDYMTGRVFEYLWQYLWTGAAVVCPSQHACYCDGYGACFADEADFQKWFETRYWIRRDEWELMEWQVKEEERRLLVEQGKLQEVEKVDTPPDGRIEDLKAAVNQRWIVLADHRAQALQRGMDPKVRAAMAGRKLDVGDGA